MIRRIAVAAAAVGLAGLLVPLLAVPAVAHGEDNVFDEAEDPAEVQYPAVEPSGTQLSGRLDRESARLNAALTAERDQAKDDAASASRLATIGLIVGTLGLVAAVAVGFLALRRQS
jgi:hypothetical protein